MANGNYLELPNGEIGSRKKISALEIMDSISKNKSVILDVGGGEKDPILLAVDVLTYGREKGGMQFGGVVEILTQNVTVRRRYSYVPLNEFMKIFGENIPRKEWV